jgi:S-phase kinase-associated protein 1
MSADPNADYVIASNDDVVFTVKVKVASRMGVVRGSIEDGVTTTTEAPLPLPNVSSKTLKVLIDYATEEVTMMEKASAAAAAADKTSDSTTETSATSATTSTTSKTEESNDDLSSWQIAQFKKLPVHDDRYEMMMACNYLNYVEMLDAACTFEAGNIKGKTPDEIRAFYGIKKPVEGESSTTSTISS